MNDMTPSDRELVDEYASRLLDGDVSLDDIPARLSDAIDARVVEFGGLRSVWMGDENPDSAQIESSDASAAVRLAIDTASPTTSSVGTVSVGTSSVGTVSNIVRVRRRYVATGLAAAAVVAVVVAIGVSDRVSAPDDVVTAESTDDPATDESATERSTEIADAPAATEAPAAMAATEAIAPTATADAATNSSSGGASAPGVDLQNVEALRSFLFSEVVANGRLLDGVLTRAAPLCPDPDGRVAIDRVVMVDGRPAELHWSATAGAVVYLIDDCSGVLYVVP